jgi:hypothetical protein
MAGQSTGGNMAKFSLTSDLAAHVAQDVTAQQALKTDPVKALADLAAPPPPLQSDAWIYRLVVLALGLALLIALLGAIVLSFQGKGETPQILTALGSAAVGALAGLLAPSPASAR